MASADSASVAASLGCGVPTAVADLHEGETVLDLGSGAGADVLISARRVGETGRVIGLDMTDEMLELARANAQHAGVSNVQFVKGYIEDIPPTPPPPARCGTRLRSARPRCTLSR
ncbi:MAG: methyltransferase domain-containing protein, partial [Solirubrobacteraceae bacterium]